MIKRVVLGISGLTLIQCKKASRFRMNLESIHILDTSQFCVFNPWLHRYMKSTFYLNCYVYEKYTYMYYILHTS